MDKIGGNTLELLELGCLEIEKAIVIYIVLNVGNTHTFLREDNMFLSVAT